ncbi:MAG: succinylglutamate desuccinylase/aspartoacylase family protein [Planctomycetes bacterium]|nr:succinylglutamate desuccinylase/aspartoacylase family protein [Planctomycetota bacterium]
MAERTRQPFEIADAVVAPGSTADVELAAARLPSGTPLTIPLRVVHGRRAGPAVFVSACVHGDELNGVDIVRRVLAAVTPERLAGTLLAAPLLNVFGFLQRSRYLPDGRDLNRSFPGSAHGALASRLARRFVEHVVSRCVVGIDLHTGTRNRTNLPHVRADLDDPTTRACAQAFGAPVTLHGRQPDGSLRAAAARHGTRVLVYEGGEAQRFDAAAIRAGVRGCLQVLAHLGMLRRGGGRSPRATTFARHSAWVRSPRGGLARLSCALGARVERGQVIGEVADALGRDAVPIRVTVPTGRVIGLSLDPTVHQGDALVHVAEPAAG